jgi:hypothetical protein
VNGSFRLGDLFLMNQPPTVSRKALDRAEDVCVGCGEKEESSQSVSKESGK